MGYTHIKLKYFKAFSEMRWLAGVDGRKVMAAGLKGYRIAKETKVYLN